MSKERGLNRCEISVTKSGIKVSRVNVFSDHSLLNKIRQMSVNNMIESKLDKLVMWLPKCPRV